MVGRTRASVLDGLDALTYAFQPIVGSDSGETFGFEALLRGWDRLGFASIEAFFDRLADEGVERDVERRLAEKAARAFVRIDAGDATRLFFNVNSRLLADPECRCDDGALAPPPGVLPASRVVLEISERESVDLGCLRALLDEGPGRPLVAIDDFGTGYSGLQLLVASTPDIVKIDRFFVAGIDTDARKRAFLTHVASLAHSSGLTIVAEGVETEGEFRACREIGCDLVQGFLVARPTTDLASLRARYPVVVEMNGRSRRIPSRTPTIAGELDRVEPIALDAPMETVLLRFAEDRKRSFFPVVDERHAPVGIVHEDRFKALIYAPFGRTLLTSRVQSHRVREFLEPALHFDISAGIDRILTAVAQATSERAVLVTERGRYVGQLDAHAIIRTMHDRLVRLAREQNPLTKLPGNTVIADYLLETLETPAARPAALAYLDFDYFKPFNDRFGFRLGDRVLAMFADQLRARFAARDVLVAHVGGDDFFLGARGANAEALVRELPEVAARFTSDVRSFYGPRERELDSVEISDRGGATRRVPLLSVSCACLVIERDARDTTVESLAEQLAEMKGEAKRSSSKIVVGRIGAAPATRAS